MTEFDLIWTDEEKQEAEKEAYNKALDDLSDLMYQKSIRESIEMQKWDIGCWIRYKLFEDCIEQLKKGTE